MEHYCILIWFIFVFCLYCVYYIHLLYFYVVETVFGRRREVCGKRVVDIFEAMWLVKKE